MSPDRDSVEAAPGEPIAGGSELTEVAAGVLRIRAENPGPMTLDGTNTWVLHRPSDSAAVVIDPGPSLTAHAATISAVLRERGLGVEAVLLTHSHLDHSELAREFAGQVDAPLRASAPDWCTGAPLTDQEVFSAAGMTVEVVATPGHSSDSVTFAAGAYLLTGDTVLGRGTTVVAHPDGRLADYLESLQRLRRRAAAGGVSALLPGHGPVIDDPVERLDLYVGHRRERLAAVAAVLAELDLSAASIRQDDLDEVVRRVVETVYAEVPRQLWPAAALSVRAQVRYLVEQGDREASAGAAGESLGVDQDD